MAWRRLCRTDQSHQQYRQLCAMQEYQNCSRGFWQLYLSGRIIFTDNPTTTLSCCNCIQILLSSLLHANMITFWSQDNSSVIHLRSHTNPGKPLKYAVMLKLRSNYDPELMVITGLNNLLDPEGKFLSTRTDYYWKKKYLFHYFSVIRVSKIHQNKVESFLHHDWINVKI